MGKRKRENTKGASPVAKFQRALTYIFLVVWFFLMTVGVATLIDPDWLISISEPERQDTALKKDTFGKSLLEKGDIRRAIGLFEEAIEIDPDFGEAMVSLGRAYMAIGDEERAIEMFASGLKNDPLLPDMAYGNLGVIFANRGEFDKAIAYYRKGAEAAPDPTGAQINIGQTYLETDRPDSAVVVLKQALENLSDMKVAYRAALIFARRFHRDKPEEVEIIIGKLERDITDDDISYYDSETFLRSRMHGKKALVIHHLLGVSLAMTGNFDEGIIHLEKALEIQPGNIVIQRDINTARSEKDD